MEACLATNEEAPLTARRLIPSPTNQAPNDRCRKRQRKRTAQSILQEADEGLNNAKKLAFRGWKDVSELWTYKKCKQYIE